MGVARKGLRPQTTMIGAVGKHDLSRSVYLSLTRLLRLERGEVHQTLMMAEAQNDDDFILLPFDVHSVLTSICFVSISSDTYSHFDEFMPLTNPYRQSSLSGRRFKRAVGTRTYIRLLNLLVILQNPHPPLQQSR